MGSLWKASLPTLVAAGRAASMRVEFRLSRYRSGSSWSGGSRAPRGFGPCDASVCAGEDGFRHSRSFGLSDHGLELPRPLRRQVDDTVRGAAYGDTRFVRKNEFDARPIEILGGKVLHHALDVPEAELVPAPLHLADFENILLLRVWRRHTWDKQYGLHPAVEAVDSFPHAGELIPHRRAAEITITIRFR